MIADHHRGGEGPPLLLVHGFTATWQAWGPVIELLQESFEVFAPTLPGHTGGPDVDERNIPAAFADGLETMLDEIGWERPHVAGFSLGGQLALELGVRDRVRSITAIAPGGAHGDDLLRELKRIGRQFTLNHAAANRLDALNARFGASSPAFRKATLRDMMVDGSRVPAEDALAMARAFAATPVFKAFLDPELDRGLKDLDRIRVPTTILWGDSDRVLPQKKHETFFRTELPGATFLTLKRAGHVPFWDAPERVANVVTQTALAADRNQANAQATLT